MRVGIYYTLKKIVDPKLLNVEVYGCIKTKSWKEEIDERILNIHIVNNKFIIIAYTNCNCTNGSAICVNFLLDLYFIFCWCFSFSLIAHVSGDPE